MYLNANDSQQIEDTVADKIAEARTHGEGNGMVPVVYVAPAGKRVYVGWNFQPAGTQAGDRISLLHGVGFTDYPTVRWAGDAPEEKPACYVVVRHYGRGADYLTGWDEDWGTACGGDARTGGGSDRALTFNTAVDAIAARDEAQRECRGTTIAGGPQSPRFRVRPAPAAIQRERVLGILNAYRLGWIGWCRDHVLQLQKRLVALNEAMAEPEPDYEARVQALIAEGMSRGDAQGVVDAQQLTE